MNLIVPPMLPEDRKHLEVPMMPAPKTRFRKDGIVWELVSVSSQRGLFASTRLTLEFVAVDSVNLVGNTNKEIP